MGYLPHVYKFSLSDVMLVCSTLHSPAPISDTALTLTVYSVPASSSVRIVELAGGEPEMTVSLPHEVVPLLLYCTWYSEMARSVWGMVQVTLKAGVPDTSVLVKKTPVTLEGAVQEILQGNIPLIALHAVSQFHSEAEASGSYMQHMHTAQVAMWALNY